MRNIIIVGSRGYRYNYGGWETFVTEFINNYKDKNTKFYIPYLTFEKNKDKNIDIINNICNIDLYVKNSGFTTMFNFTIKSMNYIINYIKENKLENVFLIILGCKIGPLMPSYYKKLHELNVKIIMNPDGLEWKRDKWNKVIKKCFKISEKYHVKYADQIVCDSKEIKKYIDKTYNVSNKTNFIAYGAYLDYKIDDNLGSNFLKDNDLKKDNYYLYVGRFVPENNIELIIKEFINSKTNKDLVLVTNYTNNSFYQHLLESTNFNKYSNIKLIGAVYNKEVLRYLRVNAYGYIHGHSAGGTNPSLLEALCTTKLNILYDVPYNREVGEDACLYFNNKNSSLARIINKCDKMSKKEINNYSKKAKERIEKKYTWNIVVDKYNKLFDKLK